MGDSIEMAQLALAQQMMKHGQADFVASDAHSQYRRTTFLAERHELIIERYSHNYADLLWKVHPASVVNHTKILRE